MRIIFALLVTVALVTSAEAAHIQGHYGGVPRVQPAPLPWNPQPYQRPVYGAPPQRPAYVPPTPLYVPQLPQSGPLPAPASRYRGLGICRELKCE